MRLTIRTFQLYFLASAMALLAACAQLGIPIANTFNERLAVGYASVSEVRAAATTLLTAKKITVEDATNVLMGTDAARTGLDIARQLHTTDPKAAENKLTAIKTALSALQSYLISRGGG